MDIAKKIKDIREAKGLKQSDIANKMGLETPNYSRYEKRGKKLTIEQLEAIAKALDVSLKELLFSEKSSESEKDIEILKLKLSNFEKDNEFLKLKEGIHVENITKLQTLVIELLENDTFRESLQTKYKDKPYMAFIDWSNYPDYEVINKHLEKYGIKQSDIDNFVKIINLGNNKEAILKEYARQGKIPKTK